jgi:pimeloyl-ACP methyl ester carboxylesterase
MPFVTRGEVSLYYEAFGSGYPIMLIAPGSLNSTISVWHGSAAFDATVELASEFRLIAMDLRNAGGQSWAPITAQDGWHSYTQDHIAVLDHLGIERCHVLGQCIGGPLSMSLIRAAPEWISAAVLLQPSGRIGPETGRVAGFERWREKLTAHPEATPEALDSMRANLYRDDFVYTVSREFARTCQTPLLVLAGNDEVHPFALAEELARLAPNAEFIPEWKTGAALETAIQRIHEFLRAHTPVSAARA